MFWAVSMQLYATMMTMMMIMMMFYLAMYVYSLTKQTLNIDNFHLCIRCTVLLFWKIIELHEKCTVSDSTQVF